MRIIIFYNFTINILLEKKKFIYKNVVELTSNFTVMFDYFFLI